MDPEDEYYEWLRCQVDPAEVVDGAESYSILLHTLYFIDFFSIVRFDENRVEDGHDLRLEYLQLIGGETRARFPQSRCTVLEMLIGLSRRMALVCDELDEYMCFWELLSNLQFIEFTDFILSKDYMSDFEYILNAVDSVLYRTYDYDGTGGLFPLMHPSKDQRTTDLWYQMHAYIQENYIPASWLDD